MTAYKIAAGASLAFAITTTAQAQLLGSTTPPRLSFETASQRDTWHTVTLISAVVGVVGILTGDGTLVILGAAGVVVGLVEGEGSHFRMQSAMRHGVDLVGYGPVSLGVNPYGMYGLAPGARGSRPSAYVQWGLKF